MQALLDAGADRVSLADTVGYADPASVSRLFEQALRLAGERFFCGHFHDLFGQIPHTGGHHHRGAVVGAVMQGDGTAPVSGIRL